MWDVGIYKSTPDICIYIILRFYGFQQLWLCQCFYKYFKSSALNDLLYTLLFGQS